jgi:hypothetical protein
VRSVTVALPAMHCNLPHRISFPTFPSQSSLPLAFSSSLESAALILLSTSLLCLIE